MVFAAGRLYAAALLDLRIALAWGWPLGLIPFRFHRLIFDFISLFATFVFEVWFGGVLRNLQARPSTHAQMCGMPSTACLLRARTSPSNPTDPPLPAAGASGGDVPHSGHTQWARGVSM